jgi:superfamily II DNA/RNA helicase
VFPIFEQEYVTNEHLAQYLIHKQHESHCVIYAPSCKEGKEFTDMLNQLRKGCAGYIDKDTTYKERQRLFAEFESGAIQFLVNIRILVEGFNAPHIRSIFFLQVSTSDIFIIQAIGRALRPHCDKRLATIYVPFTQESDMERIQTFLHQLSTYDERIKKTISEKKMGGYLSLEHGEDMEEEEDEDVTMDLFTFRYNLIVDRMGKSDQMEEMAIKRALEYKAFYEEFERKPMCVLGNKTKEQRKYTREEQKHEHQLGQWFGKMKLAKAEKCNSKLYPSVERIIIDLLGETWYENKMEEHAIKKAFEYKTFYQEKQRKPSRVLEGKTKENKENATEEQKYEHRLATWFCCIKKAKTHPDNTSNALYPSVEMILIELLGEAWYENDNLEENSVKHALEYRIFYQDKQRKPSYILQGKTKKEQATKDQHYENKLAVWFNRMIASKTRKSTNKLYPSVEKILIDLLGETWYKSNKLEKFEENAMKYALEYKKFYQEHKRKPSQILQTKEKKENATDEQKYEHRLGDWFSKMKRAKKGKSNSTLYASVDNILIDTVGSNWFI